MIDYRAAVFHPVSVKGGPKEPILAGKNLEKLVELMSHLRGPEGCPWDRAQDYDSLKGLLLEEAYEVVDAVSARDFDALEDELGDLLFQVVFYSRLAEEQKRFGIEGVIERVHAKLVRRHPHVFGPKRAATPEEALRSWLSVKESEAAQKGRPAGEAAPGAGKSLLDGIPKTLPATLEAHEIGVRASEVGFDWVKLEDLLDKIQEEVRELGEELDKTPRNGRSLEEEVGDLLFAVSNLARRIGSDPESCLRRANAKFAKRFRALEAEVARRGKRLRECTLEELENIWQSLKAGTTR